MLGCLKTRRKSHTSRPSEACALHGLVAVDQSSTMVPCPAGRLQLAKAEEEAALATASHHELEQALQVMEGSTDSEVRQQYIETVRRMAVVQIKHAKLARELEVRSRGGGGRRGK